MPEPFNPLRHRQKALGGSVETTSGTSVNSSVTAALSSTEFKDIVMRPIDFFSDGLRMPAGNYQGEFEAVKGRTMAELTFTQWLKYGDRFGNDSTALLTGAGYVLTTGVWYPTTNMTNRKTWSFKLWEDGRIKQMYGAVGTFVISGSFGGLVECKWRWLGIWEGMATDASMPSDSLGSSTGWVAKALSALTLNSTTLPHCSKFEIDANNTLEPREHLTATNAVSHCLVARDAGPRITLDTEARKKADYDTYTLMSSQTPHALALTLTDGSHSLAIAAPKAQRRNIGDEKRGSRLVDSLELVATASSGDDELTFTIT